MRKLLRMAVLAVSLVFGLTAFAPTASASVNPYNPYALCGFGYTLKVKENVVRYGDPLPAATLYVMYNPATNLFCGVTIKERYIGVPTETGVGMYGYNETYASDQGMHFYYAGPVWQLGGFGGPKCIAYGAHMTDPLGNHYYHESANPAIGVTPYCVQ
jgi:hypothetical protein